MRSQQEIHDYFHAAGLQARQDMDDALKQLPEQLACQFRVTGLAAEMLSQVGGGSPEYALLMRAHQGMMYLGKLLRYAEEYLEDEPRMQLYAGLGLSAQERTTYQQYFQGIWGFFVMLEGGGETPGEEQKQ